MRDFDKQFEKRSKEFDRDFRRMKWLGLVLGIFWTIIYLALIGFGIWVAVMLLRFFEIV